MIWKIAGKYQAMPIKHLSKNNHTITDKKNMADLLVKTFSQNSSSQNSKPKFIMVKQNMEKYKLNFQSKNLENYKSLFSLNELNDTIKISRNTAVELYEVDSEFLRQLTKESLKLLLKIIANYGQKVSFLIYGDKPQ